MTTDLETTRPNIVLLIDDQHRWDALGSVWRDAVSPSWLRSGPCPTTPHLDELARTGVRFDGAVCTVPVCVPSRYSLVTGLRGHQTGVLSNSHYWPGQTPIETLGDAAHRAGYTTASIGKMHWKPARAPAHHVPDKRGFDYRVTYDGVETDGPCDLSWADTASQAAIDYRASCAERFGAGGENRAGYVGEVMPFDSTDLPDTWLAERARDYIVDHVGSGREDPFLLIVSLDRPHPENVVPRDMADLVDPATVALPPQLDPSAGITDHYLSELRQAKDWIGMDADEMRTAVARYLTNVTFVDRCFGTVLEALDAAGLAGTTIVAMTSDHGEMLGEQGGCFTKYSLYESAIRVPLLLRWPGVTSPGTVDQNPVELIDLMPTFLDAMGLPPRPELPGRSLVAVDHDRDGDARFSITEHYTPVSSPTAPRAQWAVRTRRFKLIERLSGESEFFDLRADPDELRNVIADSAYAGELAELRRLALREQMRNGEQYPARAGTHTAVIRA
ncbi:MAG: sulfatase family protein [Thermomicrobiales bacterium]